MSYFYLKSLHIIFVVTWFSGLFYIVRLFIYHREALDLEGPQKSILINQFKIMEKRLWYGITWPSCILTLLFGTTLLPRFFPLKNEPWLMAKLACVFLLFLYHIQCGRILKKLAEGRLTSSSKSLRIWNEVATILLVSIVFLVVCKEIVSLAYGSLGLTLFAVLILFSIKIYHKKRLSTASQGQAPEK